MQLEELDHLIDLLGSPLPEAQQLLAERFSQGSGDLSDALTALGRPLNNAQQEQLSALLQPLRGQRLLDEWQPPQAGTHSSEDYDHLEYCLDCISRWLHDGITLRLSLPDAIDLLAAEFTEAHPIASREALATWLKSSDCPISVSHYNPTFPAPLDLVLIATGESPAHPLAYCILVMLLGRRLKIEVFPIFHHFSYLPVFPDGNFYYAPAKKSPKPLVLQFFQTQPLRKVTPLLHRYFDALLPTLENAEASTLKKLIESLPAMP